MVLIQDSRDSIIDQDAYSIVSMIGYGFVGYGRTLIDRVANQEKKYLIFIIIQSWEGDQKEVMSKLCFEILNSYSIFTSIIK